MRGFSIVTRLTVLLLIWNTTTFAQTERNAGNWLNNIPASVESVSQTASTWNPASDPHPSVARILVYEKNAHSFGSGTLVGFHGKYGILLTNQHVVRDTIGLVQVHFPYGFASYAAVAYVDKTWDLAVLLISRPNQIPIVPVAKESPKRGDPLWIAGYGSGTYRLAGGRCTQYVMPEIGLTNELVEVSINARQGDSGGPIFNRKGELAGVLFGSNLYTTAGSYCGRIRVFLNQALAQLESIPAEPEMLFASIEPGSPQHRLNEGAVLAKIQTGQVNSLIVSTPAPPISSQASSIGRRGSASSRNVPHDMAEPQNSPAPLNFYPAFPDFGTRSSSEKNVQNDKASFNATHSYEGNQDTRLTGREGKVIVFSGSADSPASSSPPANKQHPVTPYSVEPYSYGRVQPEPQYASQVSATQNTSNGTVVPASVLTPTVLSDQSLVDSDSETNGRQTETFLKTFQLVAVIVVIFFVLFHLIKLMSIIEENEQQENGI